MANDLKSIEDITKSMSALTVLSFRKLDDVKKLAKHLRNVINHPKTQEKSTVLNYLIALDETHKRIFLQERDLVEVEYIFTTAKKSTMQRQRFNSLPVSEVPELLKAELLTDENAKQIHICMDCNVEIELNDEVPLIESLQTHFNLEVHLPKLKRESVDVAEPIILPTMSRRLSAMASGETPAQSLEQIVQKVQIPVEKLDRMFSAKFEASLIRHLPDNSEASIDAAVKYYQEAFQRLCCNVASTDFSNLTSSVAPIIMSIKDNVNQHFATDSNKNYENDDNEQTPEKNANKNQAKKYRYYGNIENNIVTFLLNHKLITLLDDRTGKIAFFCMACEYYTLRFRYDSVLNHVLSETHIHNLSCILQADKYIPFLKNDRSVESIRRMEKQFLKSFSITTEFLELYCCLCNTIIEDIDNCVVHMLDECHLAKLSDKCYRIWKQKYPDGVVSDEWGQKSLDWSKFLSNIGKPLTNRDHVVIENFIKPSGKIANYCTCCDMTLKGPRQVLFSHIRQKKHLRNAAPLKLSMLYKNYCRPCEYYASFGNFYVCSICPKYIALPSFAAFVEHIESTIHVETIAKLICLALYPDKQNEELDSLTVNHLKTDVDGFKCLYCHVTFKDLSEGILHILCDIEHQNSVIEATTRINKGDIISVYMQGNYILHSEGATFTCVICGSTFNSIRSLLNHLVFAEHILEKPSPEIVFRFYLELKHNINMMARNKYIYYDFAKLKCGVCDADIEEGENAKRHVLSTRHREKMGASYVNVNIEVNQVE